MIKYIFRVIILQIVIFFISPAYSQNNPVNYDSADTSFCNDYIVNPQPVYSSRLQVISQVKDYSELYKMYYRYKLINPAYYDKPRIFRAGLILNM